MSDPLALARIRARRLFPRKPPGRPILTALQIAAHRAGRQLLDVPEHDGGRGFLLGWPDGIDAPPPPARGRTASARSHRPCLWSSPPASAVAGHPDKTARIRGSQPPRRRFSRLLIASPRALEPPARGRGNPRRPIQGIATASGKRLPRGRGSDGLVRLGPEIAAWGDRDIQRLRDRFEDFPGVQVGAS